MQFQIPSQPALVLGKLAAGGYRAHLVGGCVRDELLGRTPRDWDVTTDALPEETARIFAGIPVIPTGMKHGTVTVLAGGTPVEVTTYRVDGAYSDGRHPDSVRFTRSLAEDLARRDFTVNALAYSEADGLVDLFGGKEDLAAGVIRCVGDPDDRFREDSLRVLRALRLCSELGFTLESKTAAAALRNRALLERVSAERIRGEFTRLLCGKEAASVLRRFREIAAVFVPEIRPAFGFDQRNPHHAYDVWEHTLRALEAVELEPVLRLTMFLHDLGKPACFSLDRKGIGHFYGHPQKSAELAGEILARLKYDTRTRKTVALLVARHGLPILPDERCLRRRLNMMGEADLRLLVKIQEADAKGKGVSNSAYLAGLAKVPAILDRMLEEQQCFSLRGLAVDGDDLAAAGVPVGPEIGRILRVLLGRVLDGSLPNTREALLESARLQKDETKR